MLSYHHARFLADERRNELITKAESDWRAKAIRRWRRSRRRNSWWRP